MFCVALHAWAFSSIFHKAQQLHVLLIIHNSASFSKFSRSTHSISVGPLFKYSSCLSMFLDDVTFLA